MIDGPLGIAGVGLIGGSVALRARSTGVHVIGYDHDPAVAARALESGALDASASDLLSLAAACHTLVVSLPVDATVAALERLSAVRGPRLIIDVASVKGPMVRFGPALPTFVGTHPMAGRERGGIDAADARLFERATWAYLPHADPRVRGRLHAFIAAMGARGLEIAAARHDAIVAVSSHLPQVLSVTLGAELAAARQNDELVTNLCGPGMMSMLRLARSPATTWRPIVAANAEPLALHLRSVAQALLSAADGLDRGDSSQLMSYFEVAHGISSALEDRIRSDSAS